VSHLLFRPLIWALVGNEKELKSSASPRRSRRRLPTRTASDSRRRASSAVGPSLSCATSQAVALIRG